MDVPPGIFADLHETRAFNRSAIAPWMMNYQGNAMAEGIDTGQDAGLRLVAERAGLSWEGAQEHLDREDWRPELEQNREHLLELGLWGVPSFRLFGEGEEADYCTWGQDRLWRIEQEIRRRLTPAS